MAKQTIAKNTVAVPTAVAPTTSSPSMLTVVVLDAKGQPTSGAHVSIKPSDAADVTNAVGEVQFKLGTAMRYDITASYGSNTVTVPYYVTKNGATRLVVNPVYVRAIEKQLHPSYWTSMSFISTVGIVLVLAIGGYIVWKKYFKRGGKKIKKGGQKNLEEEESDDSDGE